MNIINLAKCINERIDSTLNNPMSTSADLELVAHDCLLHLLLPNLKLSKLRTEITCLYI